MKIICNAEDLDKSGVYSIKCIGNDKIYVGSTTMSFMKRYRHHSNQLSVNNHKNSYLQNSHNKYGVETFQFDILEICERDDCLLKEQIWIDNLNVISKDIGFNINPLASGTPNMSEETIKKRTESKKEFNKECIEYYNLFKNNEIIIDEIPVKFHKTINSWSEFKAWNVGQTYDNTDHLKVSKTKTDKLKQAWKNTSERSRNKAPNVYVFDSNMNFLGKWRSSKDLEEFSYTKENNLPIKSRFKNPKNGIPINVLKSGNINKSCKTNKPYKGLYFKNKMPSMGEIQ